MDERAEYHKLYREANKERLREYHRLYREEHRDYLLQKEALAREAKGIPKKGKNGTKSKVGVCDLPVIIKPMKNRVKKMGQLLTKRKLIEKLLRRNQLRVEEYKTEGGLCQK
jgi:hypothetical protein